MATYKRPDDLVVLLTRLRELADSPMEVAIIDGSPPADDRTEQAVAAWAVRTDLPFCLRYVRAPAGLTRQRNIGIDVTSGEIVFFLDDDCIPEPGYFRSIRDVYDRDARHAVGAVCGFIDNEVGRPLSRRWRMRLLLRIVPRLEAGAYYPTATSIPYALGQRFAGTRRVDVMPGCAMSFRRSVLQRHRFSSFFQGYAQGEDMEMSLRVGREHDILWCGDAHAAHHQAPAGRPSSAEKGRMEVRNRVFIRQRHSPRPRLVERARFWLDLGFGVAWDVATFAAKPRNLAPLRHASGCLREMVASVITRRRVDEHPYHLEYQVELVTVSKIEAHR